MIVQVQDIVVGNKTFTDVTKPSEIVQLLLNEDQLANLDNNNSASAKKNGKRPAVSADATDNAARDLWNEEGDEFFGHAGPSLGASIQEIDDEGTPVPSVGRRGRGGGGGSRRGRKPGPKPGRKKAAAVAEGEL